MATTASLDSQIAEQVSRLTTAQKRAVLNYILFLATRPATRKTKQKRPKQSIEAIFDIASGDVGETDISINHDQYLYGAEPLIAESLVIPTRDERYDRWDQALVADINNGKLDNLAAEAVAQHDAGMTTELAASALAGLWKDRDMADSPAFARSLRETAQNRHK